MPCFIKASHITWLSELTRQTAKNATQIKYTISMKESCQPPCSGNEHDWNDSSPDLRDGTRYVDSGPQNGFQSTIVIDLLTSRPSLLAGYTPNT